MVARTIQLIQLSIHEAAHFSVEYLLYDETQSEIKYIQLPDGQGPESNFNAFIVSRPIVLLLSFSIAITLAPKYFEPSISLINRDGTYNIFGGILSEGDTQMLNELLSVENKSFTHNLSLNQIAEDEREAKDILTLHHAEFVELISKVAPRLIDSILNAQPTIKYSDIIKNLNIPPRGEIGKRFTIETHDEN